MSKIEIKKTELVWRGKYDDEGKLVPVEKPGPFPFQIVESINEPRIEKGSEEAKQGSLFDIWKGDEGDTFEEGWKNKLIWGDNKFVMSSLLEKFAGKIDLIYIDPPFATGADFTLDVEIGEKGKEVHKEHSIIEEKAYRDTWGLGVDSFLKMIYERLVLMKDLLSDNASIFLHCDYRLNSVMRLVLSEIFGEQYYKNEVIWQKIRTTKAQTIGFGIVHDSIFFYTKSDKTYFFNQYKEFDANYISSHYKPDRNGRLFRTVSLLQKGKGAAKNFNGKILEPPAGMHWIWSQERINEAFKNGLIRFTSNGRPEKVQYLDEMKGDIVDDLWYDIYPINSQALEALDYPTQKPEALLERIIKASSKQGDLVADFFCGSGTTCAVAEKLNRRWIGVDLGRYSIHTTRKRLLEIEESNSFTDSNKKYGLKARPFEILNLGKYERQFWQVKAFGRKDEKQALYEYLAFILKLYGAEPIAGSSHIHGKKGNSLIYIGAVDAPVTIQEVTDAMNDTKCNLQ
ncbi:MAG: hypothetical protein A2Y62_04200 [Candidatus Fischerbacteria bacterium RBG_13_37_8]|uniref:DNA methylase N-4/N-6 domain-containing protein n=1 Tax=Candidatus Fischerbacteria bacterium RBG_13_37_8 TaxID=1817863 RepID=A0A1F5V651_9BACT|nr:MAG: hypothetical protein A2Y62_04200 [Candidatus Fischerbacteria bacterium RBG_13_37_8]